MWIFYHCAVSHSHGDYDSHTHLGGAVAVLDTFIKICPRH